MRRPRDLCDQRGRHRRLGRIHIETAVGNDRGRVTGDPHFDGATFFRARVRTSADEDRTSGIASGRDHAAGNIHGTRATAIADRHVTGCLKEPPGQVERSLTTNSP